MFAAPGVHEFFDDGGRIKTNNFKCFVFDDDRGSHEFLTNRKKLELSERKITCKNTNCKVKEGD